MHKIIKYSLLIFAGLFLVLCNSNLFSYISNNGSGSGYDEGSGVKFADTTSTSIESYVIRAAGYYLQGNRYIQELLNRVEMQDLNGIDYTGMQILVNKALLNIVTARGIYERLVIRAGMTPYNQTVIVKLEKYDYYTFLQRPGINSAIFGIVENYLKKGDITGIYQYTLANLKILESLLIKIKKELFYNHIPSLEYFWRLNEICAENNLFGSYVARVFAELN